MSIWENIWDKELSLYTEKLHYDAKFKLPKKVIIFFYLFGEFENWRHCFDECEQDDLSDEWVKRVEDLKENSSRNISHWVMKLGEVLKICAKQVKLKGSLGVFANSVFEKEKPENCTLPFIYTLYLSLYARDNKKAAAFVAEKKSLRRETYPLISSFKKEYQNLDVSCLLNICSEVYKMG